MPTFFQDLGTAFIHELSDLLEHGAAAPSILDPLSPASRFGQRPRTSIELIGHLFGLKLGNPSVIISAVRPPDLRYLFGQTAWFLAGSDDLAFLSYYNPKAQNFSHDGATLCGSFGRRLFGPTLATSQASHAAELLRRDSGSRRAYLSVINREDLVNPTKETPCSCGIQFFVRNKQLHAVCSMRAQHALALLPNDAFLFLTFQSLLASELNLERGTYTHFSNTLHVYEDERSKVGEIIASRVTDVQMPIWKGGFARIAGLLSYEAEMRAAVLRGDGEKVSQLFEGCGHSGDDMCRLLKDALYVIATKKLSNLTTIDNSALDRLRQRGIEEAFL